MSDLDKALQTIKEAIRVGRPLGLQIPAPAGSIAYQATCRSINTANYLHRHINTLGTHATMDGLRDALYNHFKTNPSAFTEAAMNMRKGFPPPPTYGGNDHIPTVEITNWFANKTRDEAITALVGKEGDAWFIQTITIHP